MLNSHYMSSIKFEVPKPVICYVYIIVTNTFKYFQRNYRNYHRNDIFSGFLQILRFKPTTTWPNTIA